MKKIISFLLFLNCISLISMQEMPEEKDRWNADSYNVHARPQLKTALDLIDLYIEFEGNESVLEFGCGSGELADHVTQKIPTGFMVALDSSQSMITTALQKYGQLKNVTFIRKKAEQFCRENSFDVVLSFATLHWIKEQELVLRNIATSLKADGIVLLNFALKKKHREHAFFKALLETANSGKWSEHMHPLFEDPSTRTEFLSNQYFPHNEESFKPLLEKVSLKPLLITTHERIVSFETQQEYVQWLSSWMGGLPAIAYLTQEKQYEFIDDMITRYLKGHPAGQRITHTSAFLLVKAQKID